MPTSVLLPPRFLKAVVSLCGNLVLHITFTEVEDNEILFIVAEFIEKFVTMNNHNIIPSSLKIIFKSMINFAFCDVTSHSVQMLCDVVLIYV